MLNLSLSNALILLKVSKSKAKILTRSHSFLVSNLYFKRPVLNQ